VFFELPSLYIDLSSLVQSQSGKHTLQDRTGSAGTNTIPTKESGMRFMEFLYLLYELCGAYSTDSKIVVLFL